VTMCRSESAIPTADPLAAWIGGQRARIDQALAARLNPPPAPEGAADGLLLEAMRYAVLGGGKRLRPLLTLAAAECLGLETEVVLPAAVAVELIHAYSLVHDDLPAMDDDDWRRGQPTVHKAFGEAIAVLAGDALQALAFRTLAEPVALIDPPHQLGMIAALAEAAGAVGMCGGQALDMAARQVPIRDQSRLEHLHAAKTGAMIQVAVQLSVLAAGVPPEAAAAQALGRFAADLGLAFQVQDDLLDAPPGQGEAEPAPGMEPSFVAWLGVAGARAYAQALLQRAQTALLQLREQGRAPDRLEQLTRHLVERRD